MKSSEFINDVSKVNDIPPKNVETVYTLVFSKDGKNWQPYHCTKSSYEDMKDLYDRHCKEYPYVDLIADVIGFFDDDEEETLETVVLAKYVR